MSGTISTSDASGNNRREHKAKPLNFAQASKGWLEQWHADSRLSHSERTLCTQLFLHFNQTHFEKTAELLAWPSWNTLMARTGLSKASVFRRLRNLERLGALEIEHGRYNHQTKKRVGNIYRAKARLHECNLDQGCISVLNQGCISDLDQGCTGATRLGDSRSGDSKNKKEQELWNPRGASPPAEIKQERSEAPNFNPPLPNPERNVPRAAASAGIPRVAPNGGGDSVWVRYDTPEWDRVERFGVRAVGKAFIRYGRVEGTWIPKSDMQAIQALACLAS